MPNLHELQCEFMAELMNQPNEFSCHVSQQGNISAARRIEIYTNAYKIRLRECIEVDHPALGQYMGDTLFDQMVEGYIRAFPSTFSSLRHFAENLPQFLGQYLPFKEYPILSDLAQFERLLLFAFDAAESERTDIADLQAIPADKWPEMTIRLHPSVQLFSTTWNVVEVWQALKQKQVPPDAKKGQENIWLLWRNNEQLTEFRSLGESESSMIMGVLRGDVFSTLCEAMLHFIPESNISEKTVGYLLTWLRSGIIRKLIA